MSGRSIYLHCKVSLTLLLIFATDAYSSSTNGFGFDAGQSPAEYLNTLKSGGLDGRSGTWLRTRSIAGGGGEGDHSSRSAEVDRNALRELHAKGIKICVILRWPPSEWTSGVRLGGGHRLPLDLREVFDRTRSISTTYGDLVDAWEIENEPDISFVQDNPETYAAFFKAAALGIKEGTAIARSRLTEAAKVAKTECPQNVPFALQQGQSPWIDNKRGIRSRTPSGNSTESRQAELRSRVVMAPLALPPGPYFESLWDNDVASYTDAFNFHYYGYSEDLTGVYRQFEDAVRNTPSPAQSTPSARTHRKLLAVFMTEYGFGLLDADARNTPAGRVRQWRWFADVARQIRALRVEAPMAFILNSYLEAGINEFGLSMETPSQLVSSKNAGNSAVNQTSARAEPDSTKPTSLRFTPADFGSHKAEPWMNRIGQKIGPAYTSPALAQLWDYAAKNPYTPRAWLVQTTPASPVVIDFLASPDMAQLKTAGGYILKSASINWSPVTLRAGHGQWVLYNFGATSVSGTLRFDEPALITSPDAGKITLAAGERRTIPVEFTIPAEQWSRHPIKARFLNETLATPTSHFSTALYPATYGMVTTRATDLRTITAPSENISTQQSRKRAIGEPGLLQDGRWLKTKGVKIIDDQQGHWSFQIEQLPEEPLRPAMVELPLPPDFDFKPDTSLWFEYRRAPLAPEINNPANSVSAQKSRAPHGVDSMDVYIRTSNGNLYQTWPRLQMRSEWSTYQEDQRSFTPGFFGRAALPWKFAENKPIALVFFLRPAQLPRSFEVRGASIIKMEEL